MKTAAMPLITLSVVCDINFDPNFVARYIISERAKPCKYVISERANT